MHVAGSGLRCLAPLLAAAGLLALALALRMPELARYTTSDESRWVQRASDFWALISRKGRPDDTFIIGHPGVTTMWIAFLGLGPERAEQMRFGARGTDVTRHAGYLDALVSARRAFVVANSLMLVVLVLLTWKLIGGGPALVAGALLAADPFLIAHSRLVHVDAMLAGTMALSLVSAVVFWWARGGPGYLILSGVAAGLALLARAPALYLVAFIPIMAVTASLADRQGRSWRGLRRLGLELAAWAFVAVGVGLLLWPALLSNPLRTVRRVVEFAITVGQAGHDNFFLGQPTDDPGALYYPVTLSFRLGVGTLLGLVALAVWGRGRPESRLAILFVAYALGFWLLIDFGSKKFDRYLLPLFPVLGLMAGLGWWAAYRALAPRRRWWLGAAVAGLALAAQVVPTLTIRPYYLAYYNPLLGGGPAAARVMLVGWGEGLDEAAGYINGQSDGARARVTIHDTLRDTLQAQLAGTVVKRDGGATYIVDYISARQRGLLPKRGDLPEILTRPPDHSVWINGIEYARIYRHAAPVPHDEPDAHVQAS